MIDVDVFIVGGGASGLTSSMLLSTYGVSTYLISRYPETSRLPKAHLLALKTMEIFREVGVEAAIRAIATPDENQQYVAYYAGLAGPHEDYGRQIAKLGAWGRGNLDLDWLAASPARTANLMQARLEPLLKARAEELAPGTVHFNHSFVSFVEDGDGVVVTVEDRATGEHYQVRARYLLACDGGRAVGPQVGVAMEGHLAVATSISLHFSADLSPWARDPDVLIRSIFNPDYGVPRVLAPMGPDSWGPASTEWVFHHLSFPGDHRQDDDATAIAEMLGVLGLPDLDPEVHVINRWPLDAVVASRFRAGRAFVLGDAAHRMPPSGGHGLNSAVQDCYNLCWKLAAVLRGEAGDALLDSYETERRPVAQRTVAQAFQNWQNAKQIAIAMGFSPTHTPEQNWANVRRVWDDGPDGDAARRRVGEALAMVSPTYSHINTSFGYCYDAGALVADGLPARETIDDTHVYVPSTRPGCTLPHAWVESLSGREPIGELTPGGHFGLIAGEDGAAWCAAACAVAARRGIALDAFTVGTARGDWLDLRYEWLRRREFGPGGAVLVRPDRFIAWRAMTAADDPEAVLDAAFDTIFGVATDASVALAERVPALA